jgi:hypothetical protein
LLGHGSNSRDEGDEGSESELHFDGLAEVFWLKEAR